MHISYRFFKSKIQVEIFVKMENYFFNGQLMTIFGSLNRFCELIDHIDVNMIKKADELVIGSNREFSH